MTISAYAVRQPGGLLEKYEFDPGPLLPDEVEIAVSFCGLCHTDLSMKNNDWGKTIYPFVPGHEIIGTISAVGEEVHHLHVGQTVGRGWFSRSCTVCKECISGRSHLCLKSEGLYGGFSDKVRSQAGWVFPLPSSVDASSAGPLFCGGITVFYPILAEVQPMHRVGVVGVGGLGHLAIQFLRAWGCEVTAFSTTSSKESDARKMGAHHFVNTQSIDSLKKHAHSLDYILVTVNVALDWDAYFAVLRPGGKLHVVGMIPPVNVSMWPLMNEQKSLSGSPLGSPVAVFDMLEFCERHHLTAVVEKFPMSKINEAFEHLQSGKARYRIVLENDF